MWCILRPHMTKAKGERDKENYKKTYHLVARPLAKNTFLKAKKFLLHHGEVSGTVTLKLKKFRTL